jgi:hypothetical protein
MALITNSMDIWNIFAGMKVFIFPNALINGHTIALAYPTQRQLDFPSVIHPTVIVEDGDIGTGCPRI